MRMTTPALLGIPFLLLAGCQDPPGNTGEETGAIEDVEAANRDLLHRYHVDIWEDKNLTLAATYLSPDFTSHAYPYTMPTDEPAGYDFFEKFFVAFPDLVSNEDAILSGGDRVAIQWTMTGTHTGDFYGLPPTDREFTVSGMDVLRVEDGLFVEQWGGFADQMDEIIAQLAGPAGR